jgi:predicted phosphodiesterase
MTKAASSHASRFTPHAPRLAVLADIHGNLPALEAVLADAARQGVERFIVAGDMVTGGPQPRAVLDRLRMLPGWLIRGNGEDYIRGLDTGQGPAGWRTSLSWATTRWTYAQLSRTDLDWLAALPDQRVVALPGCAPFRVVHGTPSGVRPGLFPDRDPAKLEVFRREAILFDGQTPPCLADVLARVEEAVLVCGHVHLPWQQAEGGKLALNPGSVGAPLDGELGAPYALLEWRGERWQAEFPAVPYDHAALRAACRDTGFLRSGGAFARACLASSETGSNVAGKLVDYAFALAAAEGVHASVVPDEIWRRAEESFGWPGSGP